VPLDEVPDLFDRAVGHCDRRLAGREPEMRHAAALQAEQDPTSDPSGATASRSTGSFLMSSDGFHV
jgi:hypothetical protein